MKPGPSRFEYFFSKLQPILTTAGNQRNPALWLYRNDARTSLFMLEALAKMYAGFHHANKFKRIRDHFKSLEDAIGAIDYYDSVAKDLVNIKKVPADLIGYLQAQSREKIQRLNDILAENDWLHAENNRINKIRNKLEEVDWMDEAEETRQLIDYYGESIYKIVAFVMEKNYRFNDIEKEVHELRRKLRWLSIYPQALRGAIQLGEHKVVPRHLKKYCTSEVTGSPFNVMPEPGNMKTILLLEKRYFYALSWMISELGNIKDNGLRIVALKEALQQRSALTDEAAYKKIYRMLGNDQSPLADLLAKAGALCSTYFREQNLEHLVIGVSNRNKAALAR